MATADVVVCGAGVMGCAAARELAGRGWRVAVLDRGEPGQEASWAAAGLLTAQINSPEPSPLTMLRLASRALYKALAAELREETGIDIEYRQCGVLRIASDRQEAQVMRELAAWQRNEGWSVEEAAPQQWETLAGASISADETAGLFFPEEAAVDNRRLARALWLSAARRGAQFFLGQPARTLSVKEGRCVGVRTESETFSAPWVINAAGAWADFSRAAGVEVPVRPARGQMAEIRAEYVFLRCPLHLKDFYVVPRADGRFLLGSTVEFVGYDKRVTAGALAWLLASAVRLVPALSGSRFSTAWAGLRPASPDGLPIFGTTPLPGYLLAAGLFRDGILLAPAAGKILASLAGGETPEFDIAPFSLERFGFTVPKSF